jgi:hypothetical protein
VRSTAFGNRIVRGDRILTGIFYQADARPTLEEQIPALDEGPLVAQDLRSRVVQDADRAREMFMWVTRGVEWPCVLCPVSHNFTRLTAPSLNRAGLDVVDFAPGEHLQNFPPR